MRYGKAQDNGNALEAVVRVYDRGVQERDGRAEERYEAEGKEEEEVVERDEGAIALQGVSQLSAVLRAGKKPPSRPIAPRTRS